MGKLDEAADKSKELEQNLKGAAEAGGKVAENAKNVTEETGKSKKNVSEMSQVASNISFGTTLRGIRQVQHLANSIIGLWSNSIAWRKGPKEFEIKMADINRKMQYAGIGLAKFGWWKDLDFAKLNLKELRKFDIAAQASGSTAKNVKALEYSMKRFGGTAQEALAWTKKMEYSLADMEWGGEGGALGQVAFEYGLDFTGAETQEDIDEKIANLLDTLPKRQQVRVAQMLGLSDANFQRLTEKDANGNLTLRSSQEFGMQEAEKTASEENLKEATLASNLDALLEIKDEQVSITYAVEKMPDILISIKESIRRLEDEQKKILDDIKFRRQQEQKSNEIQAEFAEEEYEKSRWSLGLGTFSQALGVVGGLYAAGKAIVAGGTALGLWGAGAGAAGAAGAGAAGAAGAGAAGAAGAGAAGAGGAATVGLMGTLATTAAVTGAFVAPAAIVAGGTAYQQDIIKKYAANGYDRSKLSGWEKFAAGTRYLDLMDKLHAKKLEEDKATTAGADVFVDETIAGVKDNGIESLIDVWQRNDKNYNPAANPSVEKVKQLNDFIRSLSQQDITKLYEKIQADGNDRVYDKSTLTTIMERLGSLNVATEGADAAIRTAGVNVSSANAAAAEAPSVTSSHSATTVDSHDSITVNVVKGEQVGPTIESLKKMQQEKGGYFGNQNENENTFSAIAFPGSR